MLNPLAQRMLQVRFVHSGDCKRNRCSWGGRRRVAELNFGASLLPFVIYCRDTARQPFEGCGEMGEKGGSISIGFEGEEG
jgi:hypothetical protein